MICNVFECRPVIATPHEDKIGEVMLEYERSHGHVARMPSKPKFVAMDRDPIMAYLSEPRTVAELVSRFAVTTSSINSTLSTMITQDKAMRLDGSPIRYVVKS